MSDGSRQSKGVKPNGPTEYPEEDWLALSGIQHFAFCRRQWALIHIEQLWQENYLTASGKAEHDRAHDYAESETRGDKLILRDLRVFSRRLGVSGACDVVEFHRDPDGVALYGRQGTWLPYPVEYKHGRSKASDEDRLQLCAEAMCLEEMLTCSIPRGALFYQSVKRRESIDFDDELRSVVTGMFEEMHQLYQRGYTPKAKNRKACRSCSLKDLCMPELAKQRSAIQYIKQTVESIRESADEI